MLGQQLVLLGSLAGIHGLMRVPLARQQSHSRLVAGANSVMAVLQCLDRPHQLVGIGAHSTHQIDPYTAAISIRKPHLPNEIDKQPPESRAGRRHGPDVVHTPLIWERFADFDFPREEVDCCVHDEGHEVAASDVPNLRDFVVSDEKSGLVDVVEESRKHGSCDTLVVHTRNGACLTELPEAHGELCSTLP